MSIVSKTWRPLRAAIVALAMSALVIVGFAVPAHAAGNIDTNEATSLTIHKYEQPNGTLGVNDGSEIADPSGNPLAGVTFSVQQVTDIDLLNQADWSAAQALTVEQALAGNLGTDLGGSTLADGSLAISGLPVGLYLVQETNAGSNNIVAPATPFLVAVPQPAGDGTWNYNVHVYPKNTLLDQPTKAVDDSASIELGDNIDWTIDTTVPVMSEGNAYTDFRIGDTLDSRLDYVGATVSGGNGLTLATTDYVVSNNGQDVVVYLTQSGLDKINALTEPASIEVVLTTSVNSIGDGTITNTAIVFVNDPTMANGGTPTNTPESFWGALEVVKHAAGDNTVVLEGAVFSLYLNSGTADAPVAGELVQSGLTTAADGTFLVEGLKAGEYVLVETAAPAGYQVDDTPIAATVIAGSIAEVDAIYIPNEQEPAFELPLTGASGTLAFTIIGLALIAVGAGGYAISRKQRTNATPTA